MDQEKSAPIIHDCVETVVCPNCGSDQYEDWLFNNGNTGFLSCSICNTEFFYSRYLMYMYSTGFEPYNSGDLPGYDSDIL